MITLKELLVIVIAIIILAFSNSFFNSQLFIQSLIFFAIIMIIYIATKKLVAYYLETEEETKIWNFRRYWIYERSYFKYPVPIGIVLPFVLSILTLGMVPWFAVLESDVVGTSARAARRHEFYSYSELTEWHIAVISASGILMTFILAIVAYILNYAELSRLCIYFAAFNLIPISKLDGSRIFFGSRILFTILWILAIIGLVYAFLVP